SSTMSLSSCSIRSIPPCECPPSAGRTLLEYADGATTVVRGSHAETAAGAWGCVRRRHPRDGRARRAAGGRSVQPAGASSRPPRRSAEHYVRACAEFVNDLVRTLSSVTGAG